MNIFGVLEFLDSSNPKHEGEISWMEDGDLQARHHQRAERKVALQDLVKNIPQHVDLFYSSSSP